MVPKRTRLLTALAFGVLAGVRAFTNMLSAALTYAYFVQTISLLNPFCVRILSVHVFGMDTEAPKLFWSAFFSSLAAAQPIIYGTHVSGAGGPGHAGAERRLGSPDDSSGSLAAEGLTHLDMLGLASAFFSVPLSGLMRIFMKKTAWMPKAELLNGQYLTIGVGTGLLVLLTEPLFPLVPPDFDRTDALVFLAFATGVYYFANVLQVGCVRELGPTLYSSLQPLRLLSTLAGTYVLLGEPLRSALAWVGLALLSLILSGYFAIQLRHAKT